MSDSPRPFRKGYVHVYTGDGKGKTTAAIGLALRAAGAGLRVLIAQFAKAGRYSEIDALARFEGRIACRQYGGGKWIRGEPPEEEVRRAAEGLAEARLEMLSGKWDVVVLDEAAVAAWYGLLDVEALIGLIDEKPEGVELVLTGRRADPRLIERADVATEMRELKHYYAQGVKARKGIEH